jgi:hypothetical protein
MIVNPATTLLVRVANSTGDGVAAAVTATSSPVSSCYILPVRLILEKSLENSHHPFYQLIHHERVVPAGFMESPRPMDLFEEALSSHGRIYEPSLVDLIQEGVPDGIREHRDAVKTSNRRHYRILNDFYR